ncbi:MAG: hypothetical protein Q9211_006674, partial [Gyalolechia sp. 1 TL-2023]
MNNKIVRDEEIESDEAFGVGDVERLQGFTSRGPKTVHQDCPEQEQVNGKGEGGGIREDSAGFSDMDSDEMDTAAIPNGLNRKDDSSAETISGSEVAIGDAEDTGMGDHESLASATGGSESETSSSHANSVSTRPPADDDRAALRKMMAESQKVITSNLSKAAKSDIAKGRAIKHQRTTFDSLLNTRIRLQRALIATNSMHTPSTPSTTTAADPA